MARETRFDRKTVGRYFAAAAALSLSREREPTEEEVHAVAGRVQARPVRGPERGVEAGRGRTASEWPGGSR